MASCNDIGEELRRIEAELEAIDSTQRGLNAQAQLADGQPVRKAKVLRTYTGDEVAVDPGKWVTEAELDAIQMGDQTIKDMVTAGFMENRGPRGRTGKMVNYSLMDPSEDVNTAMLLELMGLKRAATEKGVELARPFTSQAAAKALASMAQENGVDPRAWAEALAKRVKGVDHLPSAVYAVAKARWDSATQYADVLDELADAMEGGYLTADLKHQAGNVAKWAHYFEQMDAQVRRRVGQALVSMKYKVDADINMIDLSKDVRELTISEITGNSLVGDMLKLTAEGDAKALRARAAAKRLAQLTDGGVNQSGFMTDLILLNTFRRANMLAGVGTQARNLISGTLVQSVYMAEDAVSGAFRLMKPGSLKMGAADGLRAAGFSARNFSSAWNMAWGNASEALRTGRGTMGDENLKYITAGVKENAKAFIDDALTNSWDKLTSVNSLNPASFAVNFLNVLNASIWKVAGVGVEKLSGTEAGYLFPFRLLATGDEFIRTQAYAWKANHEAFIQAAEEGRQAGKDVAWIERRADELAKDTIFSGVFTDEDLVHFRKMRNAEYGMPVGDEIGDDELRALLYDQYHNAPNLETDIGRLAKQRGDNVTFTSKLNDPITQGVQRMRDEGHPLGVLATWELPFWKVPINGIGWILNRDAFIAIPKQLLHFELGQAMSGGTKFTPAQMADARARTVVASAMSATTYMLWESGLFTDGGSLDVRQRERERRSWRPYAFSLSLGMVGIAKKVMPSATGVDVFDLMGLQADIFRGWHDGMIGQKDAGAAMLKIGMAYANVIKNKAALKQVTDLMNWAQDPQRYDVAKVVGGMMGGVMPISGFFAHGQRAFGQDPDEMMAKRRVPTAEEMSAMGKTPLFRELQPVIDLLSSAFIAANASYPGLGQLQPREKDWLGNSIERPLGLPMDMTIPFMPVIKPQDELYLWLEKHGFGDKPKPDGKVSLGRSENGTKADLQMTNPEEDFYRETMRTVKGDIPPEALSSAGVRSGTAFPIWKYVQGQDLQGALRNLMRDPQYNAMLNDPAGGQSPSLTVQKGKSLAQRNAGMVGTKLYAPIDDIIDYYDALAVMKLLGNEQFDFRQRYQAVVRQRQQGLQQYAESINGLGVGRQ
jgi:hypothetical protein